MSNSIIGAMAKACSLSGRLIQLIPQITREMMLFQCVMKLCFLLLRWMTNRVHWTLSPQFYKCFLILFHCDHWSADNGNTSMPSKTTVIHLNRRVDNTAVACAAQISTDTLNHCCSTPASKHTSPPRGSDWRGRSGVSRIQGGTELVTGQINELGPPPPTRLPPRRHRWPY